MLTAWIAHQALPSVIRAPRSPSTTWMVLPVLSVLPLISLAMTSVAPALSRDTLSQTQESVRNYVEMDCSFL